MPHGVLELLYCVTLCYVVVYCVTLCFYIWYGVILWYYILYCVILCYIHFYYVMIFCIFIFESILLYCITLCYVVLYFIISCYSAASQLIDRPATVDLIITRFNTNLFKRNKTYCARWSFLCYYKMTAGISEASVLSLRVRSLICVFDA